MLIALVYLAQCISAGIRPALLIESSLCLRVLAAISIFSFSKMVAGHTKEQGGEKKELERRLERRLERMERERMERERMERERMERMRRERMEGMRRERERMEGRDIREIRAIRAIMERG